MTSGKTFVSPDFLDTAQLARIAMTMPEVDPAGQHHGGLRGAYPYCAALEPRIKLAAPTPILYYQRVWRWIYRLRPTKNCEHFQFDPQHERGFYELGCDCQHLAKRIKAEGDGGRFDGHDLSALRQLRLTTRSPQEKSGDLRITDTKDFLAFPIKFLIYGGL